MKPVPVSEDESGSEPDSVEAFYPLLDEVARREGWDDPKMDAYDALDPRKAS